MNANQQKINDAKDFLTQVGLDSTFNVVDFLGSGGNANVCIVEDLKSKKQSAFKYLKNTKKENKERFRSEIEILKDIKTKKISGVIPIIKSNTKDFWYTMPIAQRIDDYIRGKTFYEVLEVVLSLADTLNKLHFVGITHRDIKPNNLYCYKKHIVLGDFGLAHFPGKVDVTKSIRGVGAVFTIAPEMLRYPDDADYKKADVYSLAKTLWILLSDEKKGFDGSYDYLNDEISLRNHLNYENIKKKVHLVELEQLLKNATEYDPEKRPTMAEFSSSLKNYIAVLKNEEKCLESDWNFLGELLFDQFIPKSVKWNDPNVICRVLCAAGTSPAIKQIMNAEGLEIPLDGVSMNKKNELFFIVRGSLIKVSPLSMRFERFVDYHLNYFLLEVSKNANLDNGVEIFNGPFIFVMKTAPFLGFYSEKKGKSFKDLPKDFLNYVTDMDQKGKTR